MSEHVTLDPSELTSRTPLEITDWISPDGPDWGDAQVQNSMAEQQVGSVPVDFIVPNRQVQIPLVLKERGGTAFASVRSLIQAKTGLWQSQGGYIKRVTSSGGTVYADVVGASLRLGGGWMQAHKDVDPEALLTLECLPDFYEDEEDLGDNTETTLPELTFTESTANGGDFPLGDRVRVVVDDDSGQNQRGLIWHFRGKHYDSASTAASAYEAEALQALDTATKVAKTGASGGTVVTHGTVSTNWTPVVGTNIGGTSYLTHTGTNRIYARVFSTSGTAVEARFVYDVGDLVNPVENNPVTLYDGGTFHVLDLGEARLDPPPTGMHRWQGQIQARGVAGTESFSVDRVWIQNRDESAGMLQAPVALTPGLASFSARSEFNTESGAITGDSLAVGGTWTGAGDATDFTVTGGVATRTAISDADLNTGRYITASSPTLTDTVVQVDLSASEARASGGLGIDARFGVLARYAGTADWMFFGAVQNSNQAYGIAAIKRVSGAVSTMGSASLPAIMEGTEYTFLLQAGQNGFWQGYVSSGDSFRPILSGYDAALASGGALASGKVGIYDAQVDSEANTRTYDNFVAWAPTGNAVMFASQSAELSTGGITREDSGGTAFGPVSIVNDDLPRLPNQSCGGTVVEVFLKPSRGDLSTLADPAIDDVSARVYRRASWLTVS